ncbi:MULTISPECIES: membrane-associated sensor domain-containing protein [Kluyvera]|uniref:membrane-associated sensor domain-containing protein n=1 Tax=Kluyvera TaxID=579 RepID=UPI0024B373DC|nr:membrane-associated sensor domain-containing protein [Kluyvera ascorbata]
MTKTLSGDKQNLDIVNSWGYIWFLTLNVVFCLWLLASNLLNNIHFIASDTLNSLCMATIFFSVIGLVLRQVIHREQLATILPLHVLILGLLWAGMFYLMVKQNNTPALSLSLLIIILLPATISFYISGKILLLFSIPIATSMLLSELATFEKFNMLQIAGSIIIFIVVITARYILLEWYLRTQRSEYAKNLLIKKLTRLAHRDALTGLFNKGSLAVHFADHAKRLSLSDEKLFMIIMDIDFFKQYNDLYGHIAGDACLINTAKCISQSLRQSSDTAFRFGGEEFVILARCHHADDAVNIAERIRNAISAAKIPHKGSQISAYLTASFGVAQWSAQDSLETLTEHADKELYKAKKAGRNRVSFAR